MSITASDIETTLSPNDLSQFTKKNYSEMSQPDEDIFSRLPPEKFGPKDPNFYCILLMYTCTYEYTNSIYVYYVRTYIRNYVCIDNTK